MQTGFGAEMRQKIEKIVELQESVPDMCAKNQNTRLHVKNGNHNQNGIPVFNLADFRGKTRIKYQYPQLFQER